MKARIGGRLPAFPPGRGKTPANSRNPAADITDNSLIERCALVADLFPRHLWLQVEGVGPESAAGVGEARGADLQRPPVVTLIGRGLEIREAVFLQQSCVGGVSGTGIFTGLRRALNLPFGEL